MPFTEKNVSPVPGYEITQHVGYIGSDVFEHALKLNGKTGDVIDPDSQTVFPFRLTSKEEVVGRGRNARTTHLLILFVGDQQSTHSYAFAITQTADGYSFELDGTGEKPKSLKLNTVAKYIPPVDIDPATQARNAKRIGQFVAVLNDAIAAPSPVTVAQK